MDLTFQAPRQQLWSRHSAAHAALAGASGSNNRAWSSYKQRQRVHLRHDELDLQWYAAQPTQLDPPRRAHRRRRHSSGQPHLSLLPQVALNGAISPALRMSSSTTALIRPSPSPRLRATRRTKVDGASAGAVTSYEFGIHANHTISATGLQTTSAPTPSTALPLKTAPSAPAGGGGGEPRGGSRCDLHYHSSHGL